MPPSAPLDRRAFLRRPAPAAAPASPPSEPLPTGGGLAPFVPSADAPWDARRVHHLLRRAGVAARPERLAALLAQSPAAAVGGLVEAALAAPLPPVPSWATLLPPPAGAPAEETAAFSAANSAGLTEALNGVFDEVLEARAPGTALRERLALLWHRVVPTHYALSGTRVYRQYAYWDVLRRHALGSYDSLLREVGRTQQMLVYLGGAQSRVGAPNENYARELLELFALGLAGPDGQPTFTQGDVLNLARALTGWTAPQTQTDALFVPARHDAGQKTLFGVTGALSYDSAHDVLFAARRAAMAHHVARHLYRGFVADVPNEAVVGELAARLLQDGLELAPAVRVLLQSAHALQPAALGVRIKSPVELLLGLAAETGYSNLPGLYASLRTSMRDAGFDLFRPPDVSGWAGGRTWLDTSRLPLRWVATDRLLARRRELRALALTMPAPADAYALTADLAARLIAVPLPPATLAEAVSVLLAGIPDYEWNPNAGSAEDRLRGLVQFLMRLPEAQLF